ncbi:MAG: urease accessory protein UreE [Mesorhizobium sp.]
MKLSLNTDFTAMPRAGSLLRAADLAVQANKVVPFDLAVLAHDERQLRRRAIQLVHGDRILVDLTEQAYLANRDVLVMDDGRHVEIIAAEEQVAEVLARDAVHLAELAWHLGNKGLAVDIQPDRLLVKRDDTAREMLEDLGARVSDVSEPFHPLMAAQFGYSHSRGAPDAYGRLPGDPHYGHNHGPNEPHHDHHDHDHDHGHEHGHSHGKGEPDGYGRLPGDPHYGHNHG